MRAYLNLLEDILKNGEMKTNRTGVNTLSVFGRQLRFDLADGFPLVTTKKMHFKGIATELLWMLSGNTNIRMLVENNVNIWNDWPYFRLYVPECELLGVTPLSMPEFAKRVAENDEFARRFGKLGPVYGKQWRHWAKPDGTTVDQIAQARKTLRNDPDCRRIIVNAWNVGDIEAMTVSGLPPCHLMFQFNTRSEQHEKRRKLDMQIYIRSSDVFLGLPYNVAFYALLLTMMAGDVNMIPGELVVTLGDAHLYENHLEQARLQLSREPFQLPKLSVLPFDLIAFTDAVFDEIGGASVESCISKILLTNYECHPVIKADVAV
jgi:thymidylate synthase